MKIKIRHESVKMCTSNPKLAMLILDNISEDVTDINGEAAVMITDKVKDDFAKLAERSMHVIPSPSKEIKRKKIQSRASWTIAEDLRAIKLINIDSKIAQNDKFLRQRHTKNAIRARLSKIRHNDVKNLGEERAAFVKKVMEGKKIEAIATITKEKDLMPKDVEKRKPGRRMGCKMIPWTRRESQILIDNLQERTRDIQSLLVGRSSTAINAKKSSISCKDTRNLNVEMQEMLYNQGIWTR